MPLHWLGSVGAVGGVGVWFRKIFDTHFGCPDSRISGPSVGTVQHCTSGTAPLWLDRIRALWRHALGKLCAGKSPLSLQRTRGPPTPATLFSCSLLLPSPPDRSHYNVTRQLDTRRCYLLPHAWAHRYTHLPTMLNSLYIKKVIAKRQLARWCPANRARHLLGVVGYVSSFIARVGMSCVSDGTENFV